MNKQKNGDVFLGCFLFTIMFAFKFLVTVIIPSFILSIAFKELGYPIHYSIIGKILLALWFIGPIFKSVGNQKFSLKD